MHSHLMRPNGDSDRVLFTFAVIADSHMNPDDDSSTSPWEVNRLSNARTRAVVEDLNGLDPAFVVHLGDMVHPVPSQASYSRAAERFATSVAGLSMPLHLVPGNHDVGDKPLGWTPATTVTEDYLGLYERHFGPTYYSFTHAECTFVIVNAQLLNSGFSAEYTQREWLESTLSSAERSFVFLHYPPYVLEPEEPGHYDNLDQPARSWFLDLVGRYRVEAVFAGHVHNFFYDRLADTDFYILPSISFVRSDYSEFARIVPSDEDHGRNDTGKLGYFLIDVLADDHRPIIRRTHGAADKPGGRRNPCLPTPARGRGATTVGVDLRHPWAEIVDIPYTGGVDEFGRKRARNDYPLLAFWELGINQVRVPIADLADKAQAQRAHVLARNGLRFIPFLFDLPDAEQRAVLDSERSLIAGVELILPGNLDEHVESLRSLRADLQLPLFVSKLRGHDDSPVSAGRYYHVINHGYLLTEVDGLARRYGATRPVADGIVFRVGRGDDPIESLRVIDESVAKLGMRGVAHVRLAGEAPASADDNEYAAACRIAQTLLASAAYPDVTVVTDSLVDQDRGYFPRTGLIDRRFNLRPAGQVFRNLNAALPQHPAVQPLADPADLGGLHVMATDQHQILLLPQREQKIVRIPLPESASQIDPGQATVLNLVDGVADRVECVLDDRHMTFREPITIEWPTLVHVPPSDARNRLRGANNDN